MGLVKRIFKKGKYRYTLESKAVLRTAESLYHLLKPLSRKIELAGSIRRKVWLRGKAITDIDIVIIPKDRLKIEKELHRIGRVISSGDKLLQARVGGIKIDIYYAEPDYWGAMLLFATGSGGHNIGLRQIAKKNGLKLNQYGVWRGDKRIASRTEIDIYKALKRPLFKSPEERY